jgi:hypothetical protein
MRPPVTALLLTLLAVPTLAQQFDFKRAREEARKGPGVRGSAQISEEDRQKILNYKCGDGKKGKEKVVNYAPYISGYTKQYQEIKTTGFFIMSNYNVTLHEAVSNEAKNSPDAYRFGVYWARLKQKDGTAIPGPVQSYMDLCEIAKKTLTDNPPPAGHTPVLFLPFGKQLVQSLSGADTAGKHYGDFGDFCRTMVADVPAKSLIIIDDSLPTGKGFCSNVLAHELTHAAGVGHETTPQEHQSEDKRPNAEVNVMEQHKCGEKLHIGQLRNICKDGWM